MTSRRRRILASWLLSTTRKQDAKAGTRVSGILSVTRSSQTRPCRRRLCKQRDNTQHKGLRNTKYGEHYSLGIRTSCLLKMLKHLNVSFILASHLSMYIHAPVCWYMPMIDCGVRSKKPAHVHLTKMCNNFIGCSKAMGDSEQWAIPRCPEKGHTDKPYTHPSLPACLVSQVEKGSHLEELLKNENPGDHIGTVCCELGVTRNPVAVQYTKYTMVSHIG